MEGHQKSLRYTESFFGIPRISEMLWEFPKALGISKRHQASLNFIKNFIMQRDSHECMKYFWNATKVWPRISKTHGEFLDSTMHFWKQRILALRTFKLAFLKLRLWTCMEIFWNSQKNHKILRKLLKCDKNFWSLPKISKMPWECLKGPAFFSGGPGSTKISRKNFLVQKKKTPPPEYF